MPANQRGYDVAIWVQFLRSLKVGRRLVKPPEPIQTPAFANPRTHLRISTPRIQLDAATEPLHRLLCQLRVALSTFRGLHAESLANVTGRIAVHRVDREGLLQERGLRL